MINDEDPYGAGSRVGGGLRAGRRDRAGKGGELLEKLPSVTVESPIRSDGKRCNALLAWGDGVEPYLANASAEERCAVEKEAPETFRVDAFLESRQVNI
jgi:hypothetical protein